MLEQEELKLQLKAMQAQLARQELARDCSDAGIADRRKVTEDALRHAVGSASAELIAEYRMPPHEVWEGVQANFEGTFYLLIPKLLAEMGAGDGGSIDLADHSQIPALTKAIYRVGLFSTSAVDTQKNAHFEAQLDFFCEQVAKSRAAAGDFIVRL